MKEYLIFVARRVLIVYIISAVLFLWLVDFKRINYKMLDTLRDQAIALYQILREGEIPDDEHLRSAESYYQHYRKVFPQAAEAYAALGYLSAQLRRAGRAERYYTRAVKLDPGLFGVWHNLGVLRWDRGDFYQAAQAFEKALSVPIESAAAYPQSINPYADELTVKETDALRRRVMSLQYAYSRSLWYLLRCRQKLGQYEEKERDLEQYTRYMIWNKQGFQCLSAQSASSRAAKPCPGKGTFWDQQDIPAYFYYPPVRTIDLQGQKKVLM